VFSPDGRFIATRDGPCARIWNARTWRAIPPIFVCNAAVQQIQFSPAGDRLLIASADGTARAWAVEERPADELSPSLLGGETDWTSWAQLLSGRQLSSNDLYITLSPETLRQHWQALKSKFPSAFAAQGLSQWHPRTAALGETSQDWFAAGFHWERALALQPGEERFRASQERAARELARLETTTVRGKDAASNIPPRSAEVRAELIDLSDHYNAALTETWLPTGVVATGNDLSALPQGVRKFNGVEFDVRGIIQLAGGALENLGGKFPREAGGIPIGRACRKIHFLHGAAWSARAGTPIGSYVVRYADGESREVRIVFGQNVREWLAPPAPQLMTGAAVAWEGSNPASRALGLSVRLYQMTWLNPLAGGEVQVIDFKSTMENPAPFLIAITVE